MAPATLISDLATFRDLFTKSKASLLRACYWYSQGRRFRGQAPIAMIAMANAIECLLPRMSGSPCGECITPTGPSRTKLFKHFLAKYTTLPIELEARRDALYRLRSKLVHGGLGAPTDADFFSGSRHGDNDPLLMDLVVQTGLIGWHTKDAALGEPSGRFLIALMVGDAANASDASS